MATRLKVLMSAYACEPDRGSEPEVGWQWALQMARFHDVTVVTRANNREVITKVVANFDGPKPDFVYYDLPGWMVALKRKGFPVALYYLFWQIGVRKFLGPRLKEFDLIHHLTFNSFRQPGFWWFCKRPVVLGPLGGGQICPWRLLPSFGWKMIPEIARSISVCVSPIFPHLYFSFAMASTILVANNDTARKIPSFFHRKIRRLLETGISRDKVEASLTRPLNGGTKLLWISRLEKIKACTLAIHALAMAIKSEPNLSLSIVGGGPDEAEMKELSAQLGLEDSITWHGKVHPTEIQNLLRSHDVFIFTSVRDTSGNVILEAMSVGLPVIALKHHGAAEITTEETALRVEPESFDATVIGLSDAILKLASSPKLRQDMGAAGLKRIQNVYAWDKKGEQMDKIYRAAVSGFNG